jgi:hypothetical protein
MSSSREAFNGGVGLGIWLFKKEFYYCCDWLENTIDPMRLELKKSLNKYNSYILRKLLE